MSKAERGKYAARARRALASVEIVMVDKKVAKALGGPEAIVRLLDALAAAIAPLKKRRRRAA